MITSLDPWTRETVRTSFMATLHALINVRS